MVWFFLLWTLLPLATLAEDTNGPTIRLCYGSDEGAPNPVADFMYFVPLISRAPVSCLTSAGSTQSVRIISAKRSFSKHSFSVTCEAELTGDGCQQSIFDLTPSIQAREHPPKSGARHLKSIEVQGAGAMTVEVEGTVSDGAACVREVRLRFNAHGHPSPVSIDLCELHAINGDFQPTNEMVARVTTLTFRRQPGPPTMEVSVASVKHKDAGSGFWQNLKGRVAGAAVNMLIDPLTVEAAGHEAMLDFGQALVAGAPSFTFPRARNLQTNSVP